MPHKNFFKLNSVLGIKFWYGFIVVAALLLMAVSLKSIAFPPQIILKPAGIASPISLRPADTPLSGMLARVDMETLLSKSNQSFCIYLGMTNNQQMLVSAVINRSAGKSRLFWIDSSSTRPARSQPLGFFSPDDLKLSKDGRILLGKYDGANDAWASSQYKRGEYNSHRLYVLRTTDLSPLTSIDIQQTNNINGINSLSDYAEQALLAVTTLVPYTNSGGWTDDHLEIWDWRKNQLLRTIKYVHAHALSNVLLSPDHLHLTGIFLDEQQAVGGIIDWLDPQTGDILWHIQGNAKKPIDTPFFFLPDGSLVSQNNVYRLKDQSIHTLLPRHPELRCVSGTGEATSFAFFSSKQGLELWNIPESKMLKHWPQITNAGQIFLSPDKTILAAVCSPEVNQGISVSFFSARENSILAV